jgi:hypothetical protein
MDRHRDRHRDRQNFVYENDFYIIFGNTRQQYILLSTLYIEMFSQRVLRSSCKQSSQPPENQLSAKKWSCLCHDSEGTYDSSGYAHKAHPIDDVDEFFHKLRYYVKSMNTPLALELTENERCRDIVILFNFVAVNVQKHKDRLHENPRLMSTIHAKLTHFRDTWPVDNETMTGDQFYSYYHDIIFKNALCQSRHTSLEGKVEQCMEIRSNEVMNYPDVIGIRNRFCREHDNERHERVIYRTVEVIADSLLLMPTDLCSEIASFMLGYTEPYDCTYWSDNSNVGCWRCM